MHGALDRPHVALVVDHGEFQHVVTGLDRDAPVVDERAWRAGVARLERLAQEAGLHRAAVQVEQREGQAASGGAGPRLADLGGHEHPHLVRRGVAEVVGGQAQGHIGQQDGRAQRGAEQRLVRRLRAPGGYRPGGELAARPHRHAGPVHLDLDLVGLAVAVGLGRLERDQVVAGDLPRDPIEHAGARADHVEHRAARQAGERLQPRGLYLGVVEVRLADPLRRRLEHRAVQPQHVDAGARPRGQAAHVEQVVDRTVGRQALGQHQDRLGPRDRHQIGEHRPDAGDRLARAVARLGHDGAGLGPDHVPAHLSGAALAPRDVPEHVHAAAVDLERLAQADVEAAALDARGPPRDAPERLAHQREVVGERDVDARARNRDHGHAVGGREPVEQLLGDAQHHLAASDLDVPLIDHERDHAAGAHRPVVRDERRRVLRPGPRLEPLQIDELRRHDVARRAVDLHDEIGGAEPRHRAAVPVDDRHVGRDERHPGREGRARQLRRAGRGRLWRRLRPGGQTTAGTSRTRARRSEPAVHRAMGGTCVTDDSTSRGSPRAPARGGRGRPTRW